MSALKPMWYFTSPEWAGSSGWSKRPSNSANSFCGAAQGVHQHVGAAAVGHADDHVLDAVAAAAAHQFVQQRDQAVAALQRKRFWPTYFCAGNAPDPSAAVRRSSTRWRSLAVEAEAGTGASSCSMHPAALLGVADVHELGADGVGVGRLSSSTSLRRLGAAGRPASRSGTRCRGRPR